MPTEVQIVKAMVFPVVMYGCDRWTIKKVKCQRTDAFKLWCGRRLLRVPWTARRSNQSINPKGNQPWIFIGRTDAEAAAPILWPPDEKSWLRKDPDAGKDWRQEEKGTTEDEMDCERVAGRKARGLQTEEISCKCLLKFCVAMMTPGSTWTELVSHLELSNAFFLWKCFS